MESIKNLNKGLALEAFNVLSATIALSLSLLVYAMHDYFNLFGVKHTVVFIVLIFYSLAATGYYILCFKHANEYELPTVVTRLVSLVFYTSIGLAVFFAYKIYINSPLDYVIVFFAGCIIGGLIKDVTSFVVYANQDVEKTFKLLDFTANLPFLAISYFLYEAKSGSIENKFLFGIVVVIVLINFIYLMVRTNYIVDDKRFSGGLICFVMSLVNAFIFSCINSIIYIIYFNLELALILMSIYLYVSNMTIRCILD